MKLAESQLEPTHLPAEEDLFARVQPGDITSSLQPHGDSIGKVFAWKGNLYRAMKSDHSPLYRELLQNGMLDDLVQRGMFIPTWQVDLQLSGYDLVVQHQRMPHVVYPTEWCWSMMRDAAVATLDVQIAALQHNATLDDAHPWNVIFNGTQPVLVDLTAIISIPDDFSWPGEESFVMEFLRPLKLMSAGRTDLAHLMLNSAATDGWELWKLWTLTTKKHVSRIFERISRKAGLTRPDRSMIRAVHRRQQLAAERPPKLPKPLAAGEPSSPIVDRIAALLPTSVLVINERRGHGVSVDLARKKLNVLSVHRHADDAEALYQLGKAERLNLCPVIADALSATSTFGVFGRPDKAGLPTRLRSDAVVFPVPAGVPTSAEAWMTFDQRLEAAAVYAKRFVAIELQNAGRDFSPPHQLSVVLERHFSRFELVSLAGSLNVWLIGWVRT